MGTNHAGHGHGHGHDKKEKKLLTKADARKDPHFPKAPKMKWSLEGDYSYVAGSKFGRFLMLHSIWIVYGLFGRFHAQEAYNASAQFKNRVVHNASQTIRAWENDVAELGAKVREYKTRTVDVVIPSASANAETRVNPEVVEVSYGGVAYIRLPDMASDVYEDAAYACNWIGYSPATNKFCTVTLYTVCETETGEGCANTTICNMDDGNGGSCGPMQINGMHRENFDEQKFSMSFDECRLNRRCAMMWAIKYLVDNRWGRGTTHEEVRANNAQVFLGYKGVRTFDTCVARIDSLNAVVRNNRTPEIEEGIATGRFFTDQYDTQQVCQKFA
ncbi:hypothetical protein IT409_02835 [Candidatus Falkowbacteria bacterium]|nr:hypothetical protein [Candidatus Falkowbacteria bacterium]